MTSSVADIVRYAMHEQGIFLERKRLDAAATKSLRETTNEIVLMDAWGVGQAMMGRLEDNDKGLGAGTKPFGRKTDTYNNWFKEPD